MTQKALRFALEALDNLMYWDNGKSEYDEARDAIIAIKEALAQRTWVGIDWSQIPDEQFDNYHFGDGANWAEQHLKEKNT